MTFPITTASSSSALPNTFESPAIQDTVQQLVNLPLHEIEKELELSYCVFDEIDLFELTGLELLKRGSQSPSHIYLFQYWGILFLEKAASLLHKKDYLKALQLRLKIAEKLIPSPSYPDLNSSTCPKRPWRIDAQYEGGSKLKNGYFFYSDIIVDEKPICQMTFQLSLPAAEEVRQNLNMLDKPEATKILIDNGIGSSITLATTPYIYYTRVGENKYLSNHPNNIQVGTALTLNMEGLGAIQIGNEKKFGSMITAVRIFFNQHPSFLLFTKVLAIMGLAEVMTPSFSTERIKKCMLIRFYDPKFAAKNDDRYHHIPLKEILKLLPKTTKAKVNKHFLRIKNYRACGEIRYKLPHLVDQAEALKGKGFMIKCTGDLTSVAARLPTIFKHGLIAKQKFFEKGFTHIKGVSTLEDFEERSADGVFTTFLPESSLGRKYVEGCLISHIQIFAKLKICKQLPYCYSTDEFGTRKRGTTYKKRPTWKAFVKEQQKNWCPINEAIFKYQISPNNLVPLITYQDYPRQMLLKYLEDTGMYHLFEGCYTIKDRLNRLSDLYASKQGKEILFRALEGPNFDPSTEVFINPYNTKEETQEKKLGTHWLVDPYYAIKESLIKNGFDFSQFTVIEQTEITKEVLDRCHVPLLQKARELALTPHFVTQETNLIRSNTYQLLDAIRSYLNTLSREELVSMVGNPQSSGFIEVKKWCEKFLYDIEYSGQGSLNLELLTQDELLFFRNPHGIIALFAAEAIENKFNIALEHKINIFTVGTDKNTKLAKISECLYFGLMEYPPVLLERLPTLQWKNKVVKEPSKYLRLYLNRAKKRNFQFIIKAIEDAFEILFNKKLAPYVQQIYTDRPYQIELWKTEYQELFSYLLHIIEAKNEDELLSIYANKYTPQRLKDQVMAGFKLIMDKCGRKYQYMTLEKIVQYITQSESLLDQQVFHHFYDRVHFLAALKSEEPRILTAEGKVSLKTLMIAIIQSFANGVNLSNSIAAEQFYLRLNQIGRTFS